MEGGRSDECGPLLEATDWIKESQRIFTHGVFHVGFPLVFGVPGHISFPFNALSSVRSLSPQFLPLYLRVVVGVLTYTVST